MLFCFFFADAAAVAVFNSFLISGQFLVVNIDWD
jgi:hypothetical protein